jgi:hypothetical protein
MEFKLLLHLDVISNLALVDLQLLLICWWRIVEGLDG